MVADVPLFRAVSGVLNDELKLMGNASRVHSRNKEKIDIESGQSFTALSLILWPRVVVEDRTKSECDSLEVLKEDIGEHDTQDKQHLNYDDREDSGSWLLSEPAEWKVKHQVHQTHQKYQTAYGDDDVGGQRLTHQVDIVSEQTSVPHWFDYL